MIIVRYQYLVKESHPERSFLLKTKDKRTRFRSLLKLYARANVRRFHLKNYLIPLSFALKLMNQFKLGRLLKYKGEMAVIKDVALVKFRAQDIYNNTMLIDIDSGLWRK